MPSMIMTSTTREQSTNGLQILLKHPQGLRKGRKVLTFKSLRAVGYDRNNIQVSVSY